MRRTVMVLVAFALVACGQNTAPAAPGWTQTKGAGEIVLSHRTAEGTSAFALACTKAGATLTLSADIAQVGIANMAPPFAIVVSGASYPAALVPGAADATVFSVRAPLTPNLLASVRDATTARISVNDGYAFAESDIDPSQSFKTFAADCAALTGVGVSP